MSISINLGGFNEDDWGEVINGLDTYRAIVAGLRAYGSVLIGWTDGAATHYDILFSFNHLKHGNIQGGLHHKMVLMVSVVRCGCFGFDIASRSDLHHDYITEKLNVNGTETALKVADLIMGVRKILAGT